MKSKLEIYALAVCFAAIVCIVISGGIAAYSVIEVVDPELTMSGYDYDRHQSNDAFKRQARLGEYCCTGDEEDLAKKNMTEEEVTKLRSESFVSELRSEARGGLQSLIKSAIFLMFGFLALWVHWGIAKRARA